ncbi:hypothetical protein HU200_032075 [Digitaria exilis]|uniref:PHD-type zinc finger plants domain-containing protein n=1 Tax=Digitaria exilis TaxID=1010633 RepID=A0A835BNN0_9POAL|nr:hypothetical protein HU200_032075 [Digitaria exilis]
MASSPSQSPPPAHAEGGPSPTAGAAVCCMCGDHGLPGELVRCRRCRVRVQHRYCSDLYPRAAAYRRCNWCLRDQQAVANNRPEEKRRKTASGSSPVASDEERQRLLQRHEGWCSSRRSPAEPGHPVKKKHRAEDEKMAPPPPPPLVSAKEVVSSETRGGEEVMRAGKTRVNRVKVRRYKLLAEVISC